ncbi:phosphatidylglycerol lysyltransferase domain-containing protein [Teichococcus vastitatis]|uniref:Phosphatidylglycerol lysyltransferase domain-containing protein n=1 Tax=Teichococcus vastitatis TaxID=2307076 RepID=A0ABS9VZI7_9PROT|nr:phosphatidylglycerol lysyltransferase domain-containing protein [Pseudoroseomonas vastitatis]MCI0752437.1 phosphatidylglycerol lysyltransferase domain-containing protein [Pseudoroseomonas vastitatis]
MSAVLRALRRHGPTVFGLLLLIGALYVVQREMRHLSMAEIRAAISAVPSHALWVAGGWTVLAYGVLTIYDRLGSVYAGKPVSYARTSLASFCAYTLAHNLGFAAVSGAAVRYRFYAAWGLTPAEIAKVIAFTSLTFGLGGMALGGLVLIWEPEVVPWIAANLPHWAMQLVGLLLLGVVAGYILLSRFLPHFTLFGYRIDLPGFRMACAQTVLASVDVAVTAMIFYALLPSAEGLSFARFLGIYLAAYTAGLAANVPGGLGVFDSAVLIGLQPYVPAPQVIGALLLFRFFYYIVPLFLAGALFAGFEVNQRRHLLTRIGPESRVTDSLEGPALAGLSGLSGVALLFIGALPARGSPLAQWVGEWAALASHFAASVIGSLLLVVAYGMVRRLRIAWVSGIVLLMLGSIVTLLRGEPWFVSGGFLALAGLLACLRTAFYRDARLTGEPLAGGTLMPLAASVMAALILAQIGWQGPVADEPWWAVPFSTETPHTLRFAVGVSGVLLLVAVFRLLRPARIRAPAYDLATRTRLLDLGARVPAEADGAIFAEGGRGAGFAFVRRDDVWIGLGDPAGDANARIAVLWRFRDLCERNGVAHAFWQVGPELIRAYEDTGLAAVPLGDGRYLACRAENDPQRLLEALAAGR